MFKLIIGVFVGGDARIPFDHRALPRGRPDEGGGGIEIIKPGKNDSFMLDPLIPDESEGIIFQAQAGSQIQKIDWIVDNQKVGEGLPPAFRFKWNPIPGKFTVEARSGEYSDKRSFEVIAQ